MSKAPGRFDYVNASPEQIEKMERVRGAYKELEKVLDELPQSRLLSVAFTLLEQSATMANKSITHETPKKAE